MQRKFKIAELHSRIFKVLFYTQQINLLINPGVCQICSNQEKKEHCNFFFYCVIIELRQLRLIHRQPYSLCHTRKTVLSEKHRQWKFALVFGTFSKQKSSHHWISTLISVGFEFDLNTEWILFWAAASACNLQCSAPPPHEKKKLNSQISPLPLSTHNVPFPLLFTRFLCMKNWNKVRYCMFFTHILNILWDCFYNLAWSNSVAPQLFWL